MALGRDARAKVLAPLLPALSNAGIRPDHVTIFAGIIGLLFLPLWLSGFHLAALLCIAVHVILDGIDGPLARITKVDSAKGSFTDTFADQLVVSVITIGWMITSPSAVKICLGSAYILLYVVVVAMAMVRNSLEIPYSWLIRPRFFVYMALLVEYLSSLPVVLPVISLSVAVLSLKTASGFLAIRKQI